MCAGGEVKFTHECPWACAILESVTITSTNHVQSSLSLTDLRKIKQNDDPTITAVKVKEPTSQVNLYSMVTETRAKLRAAARAVWN